MKAVFPPALFRLCAVKGLTPVIATVMLMLITVGVVGVTYTWFSNMMTTQTEKNIAIPVGGIQCINNRISAIVTNVGANSNITDDDIVVADVNGVSVKNTPFFGGFNVNGLVGYWRFENESSIGATAADYSGYGNTGTLTSMNVTGNATSGWNDTCRFGKCLNFDGVNDYVNLGTKTSLQPTGSMSIAIWFKYASLIDESALFSNVNGAAVMGLHVRLSNSNILEAWYNPNGNYYQRSTATLSSGWNHAVFTFDAGTNTFRAYLNGVAGTPTTSPSPYARGVAAASIGRRPDTNGNFFNGVIDEVMIWNRVLAQDEITQLNKTNSGNFTMAPNRAITLINRYPVSAKGKYTVRVGTRNGVIERMVECL